MHAFRYLSVLSLPILAFIAFRSTGWLTFLPWFYAFGFIPLVELFLKPDHSNLDLEDDKAHAESNNPVYDWLLYLMVPVHFGLLIYFLWQIGDQDLSSIDRLGRIMSMGLLCGVIGINVAHELGHRMSKYEQLLSKALLLSSLYMHFFIEHNRGHHARVATAEDPASARYGEPVFLFWLRSVVGGYLSAWRIETARLKKRGRAFFSLSNQMFWYQLLQLGLLSAIYFFFGATVVAAFLLAAVVGILLLETVNYIEHYGLKRKKTESGRYARTMPVHSWNSDHVLGRWMLFELSRHSDHHYIASRKYQMLRYHDDSPQMPTGYPGMMILALLPPLWFVVMHRRIT